MINAHEIIDFSKGYSLREEEHRQTFLGDHANFQTPGDLLNYNVIPYR